MKIRKVEANSSAVLYRSMALRMDDINEEDRTIVFTGSSEYEAQRYGYIEILSHDEDAIRTDRLDTVAAVLLNHDPRTIAASIFSWRLIDEKLEITAKFTTTSRGEDAFTEVKEMALRGVSVGYVVHKWELDEENATYRAIDWEPYEFSLTPIPVDPEVGVGRSNEIEKDTFFKSINRSQEDNTVKTKTPENGEPVQTRDNTDPVTPAPVSAPVDNTALREAAATTAREDAQHIARQAESLGLLTSDYIGMDRSEASDKMIQAVATRGSVTPPIDVGIVTMGESSDDKRAMHFADKLARRHSIDVLFELARANGQEIYRKKDLAKAILGNQSTRALETVASLGNVTALAADKMLVTGYDSYVPWCDKVATIRRVGDFKDVHSAGLTLGGFNVPGEGNAFADLAMSDMGDTSAILMRGGTIQITTEAIYNDELGLFFDALRSLGRLGHREEDKVCIASLEAAVFSNESLIGAAFSSAALATAWASFNAITDGNSELLGLDAENILLPSPLVVSGMEAVTNAQGEATNRIFADTELAMKVINGRGLTDANDWYVFAGLGDANGLQLLKHEDYDTPQLEEIDHGSVAARKYMVTYPLAGMINNLKTGAPAGILKSVVA